MDRMRKQVLVRRPPLPSYVHAAPEEASDIVRILRVPGCPIAVTLGGLNALQEKF